MTNHSYLKTWFLNNKGCMLVVILLNISVTPSSAQEQVLDDRDSSVYETFELGELRWFKDNLKFETSTSWCAENPDSEACTTGNFYYPTDLINVCPAGWRVPTWEEYKAAIKEIEEYYDLSDSIVYSPGKIPTYEDLLLEAEGVSNFTLIGDTVFFDMAITGWIEGDKWVPQDQAHLWIIHDVSNTPQPHIHITSEGMTMHSHGHHVIDKPSKLRRFAVRCVSDTK